MSEIISTYYLDDLDTVIPRERKEYYNEQIEVFKGTGKPTMASEVVHMFIVSPEKEIIMQKRSYHKRINPGLLDKSIAGHVQYGDTADYTLMVETVQELQTPSIVLKTQADFEKTMNLLYSYLETIAVVKHSETQLMFFEREMDGEIVTIANKVHMYFGIYNGRVKPVDREAKGVLYYSIEELEAEIEKLPHTFTRDMHIYKDSVFPEMREFMGMINT